MSTEKIIASFKKKQYNTIYWLEGDEDFYIDEVVNYAEGNILSDSEASFNLTVFYGRDADWATVMNARCLQKDKW
jgi:DNA polymerase III subunit delta